MTGVGAPVDSLRLSRREMRRLSLVLALSLLLHLLGWGGYEAGRELGWWQRWHWPTWLPHLAILKVKPPPPENKDEQLVFVDVSQPSAEAPKNTKYYSSQNSRAADATKGDKEIPQLNGKQIEVVKTENVPRPSVNKLQPSPPTPQQKPSPAAAQPKPLPANQPGDLTLGRPETSDKSPPQEEPRPRTVKQALAQQSQRLPGPQMRQEGGARRTAIASSLDVKSTPFGAYDAALVEAVTSRWYGLLDSQQFAMDRSGKVTLRFRLNYDGTITDMIVVQNTVGDLLGYVCQKAISDPSPYAPWPSDMRRMVGENYREITFTFYYY
jgi:hypothetical protein